MSTRTYIRRPRVGDVLDCGALGYPVAVEEVREGGLSLLVRDRWGRQREARRSPAGVWARASCPRCQMHPVGVTRRVDPWDTHVVCVGNGCGYCFLHDTDEGF